MESNHALAARFCKYKVASNTRADKHRWPSEGVDSTECATCVSGKVDGRRDNVSPHDMTFADCAMLGLLGLKSSSGLSFKSKNQLFSGP